MSERQCVVARGFKQRFERCELCRARLAPDHDELLIITQTPGSRRAIPTQGIVEPLGGSCYRNNNGNFQTIAADLARVAVECALRGFGRTSRTTASVPAHACPAHAWSRHRSVGLRRIARHGIRYSFAGHGAIARKGAAFGNQYCVALETSRS